MFGQLLDVWWHVCVRTEQEQEGEGLTDTAHIEREETVERGSRCRDNTGKVTIRVKAGNEAKFGCISITLIIPRQSVEYAR